MITILLKGLLVIFILDVVSGMFMRKQWTAYLSYNMILKTDSFFEKIPEFNVIFSRKVTDLVDC
jgi:hypothetical protein